MCCAGAMVATVRIQSQASVARSPTREGEPSRQPPALSRRALRFTLRLCARPWPYGTLAMSGGPNGKKGNPPRPSACVQLGGTAMSDTFPLGFGTLVGRRSNAQAALGNRSFPRERPQSHGTPGRRACTRQPSTHRRTRTTLRGKRIKPRRGVARRLVRQGGPLQVGRGVHKARPSLIRVPPPLPASRPPRLSSGAAARRLHASLPDRASHPHTTSGTPATAAHQRDDAAIPGGHLAPHWLTCAALRR